MRWEGRPPCFTARWVGQAPVCCLVFCDWTRGVQKTVGGASPTSIETWASIPKVYPVPTCFWNQSFGPKASKPVAYKRLFLYLFFLIGGGRYHCLNTEPNCFCIVFQGDTIQLDLKLYKRAHREKRSQTRANKQAVLLNSPFYCLPRTQIYFQSLKQIESTMSEGTERWYSISALLLQKDHT